VATYKLGTLKLNTAPSNTLVLLAWPICTVVWPSGQGIQPPNDIIISIYSNIVSYIRKKNNVSQPNEKISNSVQTPLNTTLHQCYYILPPLLPTSYKYPFNYNEHLCHHFSSYFCFRVHPFI
jgi:hypothetical protein